MSSVESLQNNKNPTGFIAKMAQSFTQVVAGTRSFFTRLSPAQAAESSQARAVEVDTSVDLVRPFHLKVEKFFLQKHRDFKKYINFGVHKEFFNKSMVVVEYSVRFISVASVIAIAVPMIKQAAGVLVILTGVFFMARSISATININKSFKRISEMEVSGGYMTKIKDLTVQTHKFFGGSTAAVIGKRITDIAVDATVGVIGILGVAGVIGSAGTGWAAMGVLPISVGAIGVYLTYSYKNRLMRLKEKLKLRDVQLIQQKACLKYLKAREWLGKKIGVNEVDKIVREKNNVRDKIIKTKNRIAEANRADFANYMVRKEVKSTVVSDGGATGAVLEALSIPNPLIKGKKSKWHGYYPNKDNTVVFENNLVNLSVEMSKAIINGEMPKKDKIFLQVAMNIDVDEICLNSDSPNDLERRLLEKLQHYYGQGKADLKNISMAINDSREVLITEAIKRFLKDKYVHLSQKKVFLEGMKSLSSSVDKESQKEIKKIIDHLSRSLNNNDHVFQLSKDNNVIIIDFIGQICSSEDKDVQTKLKAFEKVLE